MRVTLGKCGPSNWVHTKNNFLRNDVTYAYVTVALHMSDFDRVVIQNTRIIHICQLAIDATLL